MQKPTSLCGTTDACTRDLSRIRTSRECAVGAQNRMVRMLGGRARPLADDMEGRAATDLAKQRLKMTTFLGHSARALTRVALTTETLVSICEDVFEHREEGCWRWLNEELYEFVSSQYEFAVLAARRC